MTVEEVDGWPKALFFKSDGGPKGEVFAPFSASSGLVLFVGVKKSNFGSSLLSVGVSLGCSILVVSAGGKKLNLGDDLLLNGLWVD